MEKAKVRKVRNGLLYVILFAFFFSIALITLINLTDLKYFPLILENVPKYIQFYSLVNIFLNPVCGLILLFSKISRNFWATLLFLSGVGLIAADIFFILSFTIIESTTTKMLIPWMVVIILLIHLYLLITSKKLAKDYYV